MIHKRVTFQDEIYWLHDTNGNGLYVMLSPLDHYDEQGNLLVNPFTAISFAVIEDDRIMQFGSQIGTTKDLIDVVEK